MLPVFSSKNKVDRPSEKFKCHLIQTKGSHHTHTPACLFVVLTPLNPPNIWVNDDLKAKKKTFTDFILLMNKK